MLVVPCFNEEKRLRADAYRDFLNDTQWLEYLFVDDGSSDDTWSVLQQFAEGSDRCHAMKLEKNSGKAEAVRRGLLEAAQRNTELIGYWDADLATPLEELPRMIGLFDDQRRIHGVIGARVCMLGRRIERKAIRHYVGRIFASFASIAIGQHVYDTQCGAKLFRTSDEVRLAISKPFQDRWSFDVELLQRMFKLIDTKDCVVEYPLQSWEDVGNSTVSMMGGVRAFASLIKIWLAKSKRFD